MQRPSQNAKNVRAKNAEATVQIHVQALEALGWTCTPPAAEKPKRKASK